MAPPQGIISYEGLKSNLVLLGNQFSLSHGVSPSTARIRALLDAPKLPKTGVMIVDYGSQRWTFRDCRVVSASWQASPQGRAWTFIIHDRRHRWRRGEISGVYNQRLPNGKVDPETEKTPQELAKLLLEALGDTRPDVSRLPNDQRPERNWESANPALELQRLCEELHCRVVLDLDDRVKLVRINEGQTLSPIPGVFMDGGVSLTPDPLPHTIKVLAGPVRIESKLKLRAVGLDVDGQVKPIDNLSYKPAGGWAAEADPWTFPGVQAGLDHPVADLAEAVKTGNANALARRTVYRWYQIHTQADGTLQVPKISEIIQGLEKDWQTWQLLPLSGDLVQTVKNADGFDVPAEARVEGSFFPLNGGAANTSVNTTIEDGWTLDAGRGIVKFDHLTFKVGEGNAGQTPADIYLTCSYELLTNQKERKGARVRFVQSRIIDRQAPKQDIDVVRRDDLVLTIQAIYDGQNKVLRTIDNREEIKKQAEKAIDDRFRSYTLDAGQDFEYVGFVPIEPDGAIQQVTWTTDESGAKTRASRGQEHNMQAPGHDEQARKREQEDAIKRTIGRRQIGGRQAAVLRAFHQGERVG